MSAGITHLIRDLMVKELPSLDGEQLTGATAIMRAIHDLEQFHGLMADALRAQRFHEDEALLIVAVCFDWLVGSPSEASNLWHRMHDYLEMHEDECGEGTPSPKWHVERVERLRRLSPLEALAVVRAAQRVWSLPQGFCVSTALIAVGLLTPEPDLLGFRFDDAYASEGPM